MSKTQPQVGTFVTSASVERFIKRFSYWLIQNETEQAKCLIGGVDNTTVTLSEITRRDKLPWLVVKNTDDFYSILFN